MRDQLPRFSWLNVFGPPFVRQLKLVELSGLERAQVEHLNGGGVLVAFEDPDWGLLDAVKASQLHELPEARRNRSWFRFLVELFVDRHLGGEEVSSLIVGLESMGLRTEKPTSLEVVFWDEAGAGWRSGSLSEGIDAWNRSGAWSVKLWPADPTWESEAVWPMELSVDTTNRARPFTLVSLVLPMDSWPGGNTWKAQFFQRWAEFLGKAIKLFYGWAGRADGAGMRRFPPNGVPVEGSAIAALEPQPVEWLNFLSPAYVEHLGRDALLAAPAVGVELQDNDSLIFQRFEGPTGLDLRQTTFPEYLGQSASRS